MKPRIPALIKAMANWGKRITEEDFGRQKDENAESPPKIDKKNLN